ncbi:MAG: glycosyltransferase [Bacteroidetes bacterium]|nr:glycosyltransferase [Fibrella sp.]
MNTLIVILLLIIFGYLTFNVAYLLLLAIAGAVGSADDKQPAAQTPSFRKMVVLIPAYKEDAVIIDSVAKHLQQEYPPACVDLVVIADSLQPHTLAKLAEFPVRIVEVVFAVSTVTKALNAALADLPDDVYDLVVVADSDNHFAPDFLSRVNTAFGQGWRAVQGHRVAKNLNTKVAVLDAISEEINNHLFRKGYRALNLSASIIGSGMAIEFGLMKAAMMNLVTVGGFDKELEMKLAIDGHRVGYLEQAYVYDEKVAKRAVFESQRTRWIAAQWQFLHHYFRQGLTDLLAGRLLSASKTLQAMVLPRVLLLGVLGLCFLVSLLSGRPSLMLGAGGLLLGLCVALLMAIPPYLRRQLAFRDLFLVLVLMLSFARAVFNIRKAFKSFMHTPHST